MTYDWTVPSLLAQGTRYYPNKSSDGVVDVRVFLTQVAKLLQDGLEYLGEAGTTSKELDAAVKAIPDKAETNAAWVSALRAWMSFLDNARIASKVPYPATPDNLPRLHGKKCWKNVQHYRRCPGTVHPSFTGGSVTSNHVFVYQKTAKGWVKLDKTPNQVGRYDMADEKGTEVYFIRDTRTYGEKDSTDGTIWATTSPTPEQMRDMARWVLLATMDAGGVSTEVPRDKTGVPSNAQRVASSAVVSGLPAEIIDYCRGLMLQDGWGTYLQMGTGGGIPWPGPYPEVINKWIEAGEIPAGGDLMIIRAWPSQYGTGLIWYIGTSPNADPTDIQPVTVVADPAKLPDVSVSWRVPGHKSWTARAGRAGIYLSDTLDLTDPSVSVMTWYGAVFRGLCGDTVLANLDTTALKDQAIRLRVLPTAYCPVGYEPHYIDATYPCVYQNWSVSRKKTEWPRRVNMTNIHWDDHIAKAESIKGYGSYDYHEAYISTHREFAWVGRHYQDTWEEPDGWSEDHPRRQVLPEIAPGLLLYHDGDPDTVAKWLGPAMRFTMSWMLPSTTRIV